MPQEQLVVIKMLGNHQDFQIGKEYTVTAEAANHLTGMGFAVFVEVKAKQSQVKE